MKFQNTTGGIGIIQNQNDILLPVTSIAVPASGLVQRQVTTQHGYSSLGVYMSKTAGPGQPVYASVQNLSSGGQTAFGATMQQVVGTGSGGLNQWQCILPCDNSPGDLLTVSVYWINPVLNSTFGNFTIFGSTSVTGIPQMRSDGRAYPTGSFIAQGILAASNGPVTIVAAPIAPLRVLFFIGGVGTNTAGGSCAINIIVNGTTLPVAACGSNLNDRVVLPQGVLTDTGTAVTITGANTPIAEGNILYDLVV